MVPVTTNQLWSINPWSINAGDVYFIQGWGCMLEHHAAPLPISWSTIQTSSGQSYKLNMCHYCKIIHLGVSEYLEYP